MKNKEKVWKNQSGQIMLEAMIVYLVTLMLLFFVLAIFTTLFQRWNLQVVANEAAAKIAQTYKYTDADVVTGKVSKDSILNLREYRYVFKKDEMKMAADIKLTSYVLERLSKTTFTKNVSEPKAVAEECKDALARRHIKVIITGEYRVPFGEFLSYFGYEETIKYDVVGYAECVDIIDYVNTIDFVDRQTSLAQFDSEFVGLINSILSLFDNIFGE